MSKGLIIYKKKFTPVPKRILNAQFWEPPTNIKRVPHIGLKLLLI